MGGRRGIQPGGTVELFTDHRGPQVTGAVGVGPTDPWAVSRDARNMPEIPSASQSTVVVNNPYFPEETPGLRRTMMDYLQEAARITQPGGQIYINGNGRNPYFRNRPTPAELDRLGLEIVHDGALLDRFRNLDFRRADGSTLERDLIRILVFRRKNS